MKNKLQKITFSIFTSLVLTNGSINAQCTLPSLGSASPAQLCAPGGTTNLNATSVGNSIAWYTVPVGGTSLGSTASGGNFNVNAVATTTYYAESFSVVSNSITFNFTGAVQTFSAPVTGNYTLQAWGAKGGNDGLIGANGGYATGVLALTAGQTISIYVGGIGGNCVFPGGGWNGGGNAGPAGCSGGGGGASDVRFGGTALANRVLVAGGGGGGGNSINAGAGGGLTGNIFSGGPSSGGSQVAGGTGGNGNGSLGQGGNHTGDGGGGGGGYYGGSAGSGDNGGGGGSSYFGGVLGGSTIAGNASMPNFTGGTMTGNSTDGKVIIRYPSVGCVSASRTAVVFTVNPLPTISVNSGAICSGSSFTMSASGASTYTYSSGSAIVAPTSNAVYTVTGTSALGCTNTALSNVTVNALPVISVNSGAICSGKSFTMSPSGAITYTFSSGSAVVSPVSNTSYNVTGTGANGCVSAVAAVSNVTVNALPTISVNSGAICSGNSFTMSPSGASTYSYSGGLQVVSPVANTVYTVTGASALGCTNTAISSVTVNSLPVITVNSGAICLGNSFTMIPSGATTYTFSSGSAVVSPVSNTSYNVTGTNANGCVSASAAVSNVTVNALPVISVNSGAICSGNSFTMIPSGATTYTYSSGSPVVTPVSNTSYNVTGTNANGCVSASAAVSNVTVNALPTISVNSGAICAGASFTMSPSGAVTYTYSSGSPVVTPTANASYNVIGASALGCTNTAISNVTVNALPTISVNSGAICSGNSFTMSPSGASTYTFSNGNAVVTPSANSSYTVFGTNVNGCTSNVAAVSSVTVNALPLITVNSGVICAGDSFTMNPSGATTYTFSSGSPVVSPVANTSYSVSGTDLNGCVSSIFAVSDVTVNALPTLVATSDNTLLCSGQTAILTVTGAASYTWNTSSVSNSISVTPTITTVYSVNGTDINGCVNSTSITQVVNLCTGIENHNSTGVSVINLYPNPNNGSFNMDLNETSQITIINVVGQVVYNETLNAGKQNLDILNAANGIYFVKVKQGNKQQTIKFIKE